jgi:hypothetical protein
LLAERASTRELLFGEESIDDHDAGGVGAIPLSERAPFE